MVTVTGPAPTSLAGLTLTALSLISALSSIGAGGRGLFSKSSSPQAEMASAAAPAASGTISLLAAPIVGATLAQPPAGSCQFARRG